MPNATSSVNPSGPQPQDPAVTQLAGMIGGGGSLEQVLCRNPSPLISQQDFDLHRRISGDLQTLRHNFERLQHPLPYSQAAGISTSRLPLIEQVLSTGQQVDPVLGYCLARHAAVVDLASRLFDAAWQKYHDQSDAYQKVFNGFIPEDFVNWAGGKLAEEAYSSGTSPTAIQDWRVYRGILECRARHPFSLGLPTGLNKLDAAIGGLDGLMFIAGDKGVGKTTLILQMILAALRSDPDLVVLFYSLDLSKTKLYDRLLCHAAQIDYRTLMSPTKAEDVLCRLRPAEESLLRDILPRLRVIERQFPPPHDGYWWRELIGAGNALLNNTGKKKLLVTIDMFQRMEVPVSLSGGPNEAESVRLATEGEKDDFRLDQIKKFRDSFRLALQPNGPPVIIASEVRKGDDPRRALTPAACLPTPTLSSSCTGPRSLWTRPPRCPSPYGLTRGGMA